MIVELLIFFTYGMHHIHIEIIMKTYLKNNFHFRNIYNLNIYYYVDVTILISFYIQKKLLKISRNKFQLMNLKEFEKYLNI